VGLWIAEVDEQAVTQMLRDMSLEAIDNLATGFLVRAYHLAQILWIQLLRQLSRTHQVAEHHGQLPALGFGRHTFLRFDSRGGLSNQILPAIHAEAGFFREFGAAVWTFSLQFRSAFQAE